jgi:hypothetical protein
MVQLCPGKPCSCGSLSLTVFTSCLAWAWLIKGGDLLCVDSSMPLDLGHCRYAPTSSPCYHHVQSRLPTASHWSGRCLSCTGPKTVPASVHGLPRSTNGANRPTSGSISLAVVGSSFPPNTHDATIMLLVGRLFITTTRLQQDHYYSVKRDTGIW